MPTLFSNFIPFHGIFIYVFIHILIFYLGCFSSPYKSDVTHLFSMCVFSCSVAKYQDVIHLIYLLWNLSHPLSFRALLVKNKQKPWLLLKKENDKDMSPCQVRVSPLRAITSPKWKHAQVTFMCTQAESKNTSKLSTCSEGIKTERSEWPGRLRENAWMNIVYATLKYHVVPSF